MRDITSRARSHHAPREDGGSSPKNSKNSVKTARCHGAVQDIKRQVKKVRKEAQDRAGG